MIDDMDLGEIFPIERPYVYVNRKLGRLLKLYISKSPSWETLHEVSMGFAWCETSVSGYKSQITLSLWKIYVYLNIWEVDSD